MSQRGGVDLTSKLIIGGLRGYHRKSLQLTKWLIEVSKRSHGEEAVIYSILLSCCFMLQHTVDKITPC